MIFYDVSRKNVATNASANTEDKLMAYRTIANQRTAALNGIYVSARHTGAGGLIVRVARSGTAASTGGTAITPQKRDPDSKAADTVAVDNAYTSGGGTLTTAQMVGTAAQGGFGGWGTAYDEQMIKMKPNGGISGSIELYNICGTASVNFDTQQEIVEL